MGAPVGPTGVVSCAGTGDGEPARAATPTWRGSVTGGVFWSDLVFDDDREATLRKSAVLTSHDFLLGDWTLTLGAGALLEGSLETAGQAFDLGPGWVASGAASFTALDGRGSAPFVLLSVSFGASAAMSRPAAGGGAGSFVATDGRVAVTVGKTFFEVLSPYASIRAFGGPVFWDDGTTEVQGTDQHHYQPALGLVVGLPGGFDAFAEGAPLGERAVNAGLGFSY